MEAKEFFFIVGNPRSGTTLLSVLLDRHPRLCVPPETAFFDDVAPWLTGHNDDALRRTLAEWRRLPELGLEPEMVVSRLGQPHCTAGEVLAAILELNALRQNKPRCGEKTPQHLRHVPELLRHFPAAKVICLLQDGRDNALSLSSMPWWQPQGLVEAANLWQYSLRLMEEFAGKYSGQFVVVRYEELVARPQIVLARVMAYLGEVFEPAQLRFDIPSKVVLPRSMNWKGKSLEPIDPGCLDRRRLAAATAELVLLEQMLHDDLCRYGYTSS
jgi:hypothetical protein